MKRYLVGLLTFLFIFPSLLPFLSRAEGGNTVVFSEIAWMGTVASANDEWVELSNVTDQPIDLTGWQIKNASEGLVIDLEGMIEPSGFFLLERLFL